MKLETVHRRAANDSGKTPILFVHGANHGAWCWEYWADWFADRGRDVTALSLRGHGESEGREAIHSFELNDYCDDLLKTAREFGRRPIVVGHSMGGAVTQLAIAANPALFSAAVLLASLPHNSLRPRELLSLLLNFPHLRSMKRLSRGETLSPQEVLALSFFERRISLEQAKRYALLLQPESRHAVRELAAFRAPPVASALPMLVLGSSRDRFFGRAALQRTALHYGADLEIRDEGCHDLMVDQDWPVFAEKLDTWLTRKSL